MNTLFQENTIKPAMQAIADGDIIRALWWKQPYASLMLPPFNKLETRSRHTKVRGWVLICATKQAYGYWDIMRISEDYHTDRLNDLLRGKEQPLGKAIGIGYLSGSRLMQKEDEFQSFVMHSEKHPKYIWQFDYVQAIEPFQMEGKQGWAILDSETKSKIKLL